MRYKLVLSLIIGVIVGVFLMSLIPKTNITHIVTESVVPQIKDPSTLIDKKYKIKPITVGLSNTVLLNTEVDFISVNVVISELEKLQDKVDIIYLLLDSPGGSVIDGARLYSYIETSRTPITTVCVGICASMAAHIHQAGNQRFMADKSILMFHPARGGAQGTLEQMGSLLKMLQLYVDRFDAKTAKRSGIDYNVLKSKIAQDFWVEARDAVDSKLCDGLVSVIIEQNVIGVNIEEKVKLLRTNKTNEKNTLSHLYDIH